MIFSLLLATAFAAPLCLDTSSSTIFGSDAQIETTEDGKYAFPAHGNIASKFTVLDLETGETKEYPKSSAAKVSKNGNDIVITEGPDATEYTAKGVFESLKASRLKILNPKTGKIAELAGKTGFQGGYVEPLRYEGSKIFAKKSNGKIFDIDLAQTNGRQMYFGDTSNSPMIEHFQNDGKLNIEMQDGRKIEVESADLKGTNMWGKTTPDNKFFIVQPQSTDGTQRTKAVIVDLETKKVSTLQIPQGSYLNVHKKRGYNPKTGQILLESSANGNILGLDLKTAKVNALVQSSAAYTGNMHGTYYDYQGDICGFRQISNYNPTSRTYSNETRRQCAKPGEIFSSAGDLISDAIASADALADNVFQIRNYAEGGNSSISLLIKSEVCTKKELQIECNCDIEKPTDGTSNLDDLKSVVLGAACGAPFEEKNWKELTPTDQGNLTEGQAVVWMKRFSKPGGFDPEKHLDVMAAILRSKVPVSYPGLTRAALMATMTTSPRIFKSFLSKIPKLAELGGKMDSNCLTAKEKETVQVAFYTQMNEQFNKSGISYQQLKSLALFGKDALTTLQKEKLSEAAGDRMVEIGVTGPTAGIFSSKIYYFAEYNFQRIFGLPTKDITDFTAVRSPYDLRVVQLGRDPFPGSKETPTGIHIKELGTIDTQNLKDPKKTETYKWTYGGKEFVGELAINKIDFDETHMGLGKSPKYSEMWKDKVLRGVVVAGSNLGGITQGVMNEYIEYYMNEGFTFDAAQDNDDMLKYLKEKVSGKGQMDYFIKEAHSGGDEKSMFDISKKGKVMIGTKQIGDRREVIELVFPRKTDDNKNETIRNADFGEWARDREKAGGSELLYLNTSCHSVSKAIYEIPSAASKKLVNIPTTTAVTVFSNQSQNIMKNLVDGIRQEKDYSGIRTLLKNNPAYNEGTSNKLIFPDEDEYKTKVLNYIKTPYSLESKLSVKNSSGVLEDYNIGHQ